MPIITEPDFPQSSSAHSLEERFFDRSTLVVARELLGKFLVRRSRGRERALMITEVEAYDGFRDRGSHAHRGRTPRNGPMFGPAGHWYVYLTYGIHWMLNIVTRETDYPAAVLLRGLQGIPGPGRLTRTLEIDKRFNARAAVPGRGLWIEDRGERIRKGEIRRTPRIGIDYAGEVWRQKPWRFLLDRRNPR